MFSHCFTGSETQSGWPTCLVKVKGEHLFCIFDLLDGLGDAGVVEGGGDAAVESLGVSLPLANVPEVKHLSLEFFSELKISNCLWRTPEARPRV